VAEHNGMLWGIGSILFFLVVGSLLLITVDVDAAKKKFSKPESDIA